MIHPEHGVLLAFYRGSGPVAGLIRWRTWGRWAHVGIVQPTIGQPHYVVDSRYDGGVKRRQIGTPGGLLWIPDAPADQVHAIAASYIGAKYDYSGIGAFLLRSTRLNDKDRFFCSEFVHKVFQDVGYPLLRADAERVSPEHLWLTPLGRVEAWES